jgi:hypothetical protein
MPVIPFEIAKRISQALGIKHVRSINIQLEAEHVAVMHLEILPDGDVLNDIVDILLEANWEKQ